MSKLTELRILSNARSIDAPIQYHHRTGDSEGSGGTMLDIYAQEESAEEFYLHGQDEIAKAQFLKGFSGYLRKVFSHQEREFLQRLMSGKEQPREVGRALGVDWFKYMCSIQRKAYKNTKPLLRLVELTGWSRAEEFTAAILRRVQLLDEGAELEGLIPQNVNRAKVREAIKASGAENNAEERTKNSFAFRAWYRKNKEYDRQRSAEYYAANKEKVLEKHREWLLKNKEKDKARRNTPEGKARKSKSNKAYREKNKERCKELQKAWRKANRDKIRAYKKVKRDKILAYKKAYRERKRAERQAANV